MGKEIKGVYTIELYDKKTGELEQSVTSENIVFTSGIEKLAYILSYYYPFSANRTPNIAYTNMHENMVDLAVNPSYIYLTDRNVPENLLDTDFTSKIIGYSYKDNTATSNYNSTLGYIESYDFKLNKFTLTFKFPDITANGTFNSIMMGPLSMKSGTSIVNITKNISSQTYSHNKYGMFKEKMYSIIDTTLRLFDDISMTGTYKDYTLDPVLIPSTSTVYNGLTLIPYKDNKIIALTPATTNMYVLDQDFKVLSSLSSVTGGGAKNYAFYDELNDILYISTTQKAVIDTSNVISKVALSTQEKTLASYNLVKSWPFYTGSSGILNSYYYSQDKVIDLMNSKAYKISTGELLATTPNIYQCENPFIDYVINTASSSFTLIIRCKVQPYSYTKLPTPIIKTSDKFMKITYESTLNSQVLTDIYKLLGYTNSEASYLPSNLPSAFSLAREEIEEDKSAPNYGGMID